jgi:hypothetical protein
MYESEGSELSQQGTDANEDQVTYREDNCHLDQEYCETNQGPKDAKGESEYSANHMERQRRSHRKNKDPQKNHACNSEKVLSVFHRPISNRFLLLIQRLTRRRQVYADSANSVPTKISQPLPVKMGVSS